MERKNIIILISLLIIGILVLNTEMVLARDYYIEFNQVGDKLIVKENNLSSSNEVLEKTNIGYYFIKKIEADSNYTNFVVRLNLEKGAVANPEEIFPTGYVSSSDGQTISFTWSYSNVTKGKVFAFFVSIEDKNNNLNYLWIFLILIILIGGFFIFRYLRSKKDVNRYLLDEEKKVIQLLKQAEGKSLWQKNIQSSLGCSKAKVSRLIRNLDSRGLIEKIPIGNTNKIRLK